MSPDGEVTCQTYRVQRVFAPGYEDHKLILVCEDNEGYWSMHYNERGFLVETIYVRFKRPDMPGTVEGPSLPLRQKAVGESGEDNSKHAINSGSDSSP